MKKDPRSKGFSWVLPCLTVKDAVKAQDFYAKAFGFEKGIALKGPDGKVMHADMRYQGKVVVMFASEGHCPAKSPATTHQNMPFGIYVYHEDVDTLYLQAVRAGAEVLQPPADMFWGDRTAQFKDLDGYSWMFGTNIRDFQPV